MSRVIGQTAIRTTVDGLVAGSLGLNPSFSREELEEAQMRKLRASLSYVIKNSSFYRKKLQGHNVKSIGHLRDVERLGFTCVDEITENSHLLHCVSQSKVARIITLNTSGSTGKPKRYAFTEADLRNTSDFFLQGMKTFVDCDDRVLVLMPYETEASVGELLIGALGEGGIFSCGHWPPTDTVALARLIVAEGITSVVGLPQHLLALSEVVPKGQVTTMLLASDYAPRVLRDRIEKNCGSATFLHYGATESGLGGAVECHCHCGLHVRESDLLYEVIDADSGKQLSDGEEGELVLTTLGREGMPLVRYRTGDMASIDRSPCRCGGITARLRGIKGRLRMSQLADGIELTSQKLDEILFQVDGLLDYRAQLVHNGCDRLVIEYMAGKKSSGLTSTMTRLVAEDSSLAKLIQKGLFEIDRIEEVEQFSPSHTQKRTLLDTRRQFQGYNGE